MKLIQIPFSHNCIKVRRALELKGLKFETLDISPMDREPVLRSSGQGLVPVLEDRNRRLPESTAILRHLEQAHPEPSLLPQGAGPRAECWLIEDWADQAFMERTRRIAYWTIICTPGAVEALLFPEARGIKRALMVRQARKILTRRFRLSRTLNSRDELEAVRLSRVALDRLAGKPAFFDGGFTVADISLAAMSAPLRVASPEVRDEPVVRELLAWGETVLGPEITALYERPRH